MVLDQQAILDSGVRADQWHFSQDQPLQAWSDCQHHLHATLVTQRQASSLLFLNADQTAEHVVSIKDMVEEAHGGAFLEPEERDILQSGELTKVGLGALNPAYKGLVFPGSEPEKPDLSALLMLSLIHI